MNILSSFIQRFIVNYPFKDRAKTTFFLTSIAEKQQLL